MILKKNTEIYELIDFITSGWKHYQGTGFITNKTPSHHIKYWEMRFSTYKKYKYYI